MVYVIQLASRIRTVLISVLTLLARCMTYTIAVCTVKSPDDGYRICPKHVEFYSKNKFQKLVYLVGFIIRIRISCSQLRGAISHHLRSDVFVIAVKVA